MLNRFLNRRRKIYNSWTENKRNKSFAHLYRSAVSFVNDFR